MSDSHNPWASPGNGPPGEPRAPGVPLGKGGEPGTGRTPYASEPTVTAPAPNLPGGGPASPTPAPPSPWPQPYPGTAPAPAGLSHAPAPPPRYGHGYGPGPGWAPLPPPPATSGICTAAMVLGIISMFLVTTVYGMVLSVITAPVAIGLGISARGKVKRGEAHGSGQALAGLVLGIVSFVISAVVITLVVLALTVWGDGLDGGGDPWEEGTYNARTVGTAPWQSR